MAAWNGSIGWCATPAPIWPTPSQTCSTPVVICGAIPSSQTSRASMPTGVGAESIDGIVKRVERPAQISRMRSVRAIASAASPPKNAATAGAAPTAMPPRPTHSMTAESPMSLALSDSS